MNSFFMEPLSLISGLLAVLGAGLSVYSTRSNNSLQQQLVQQQNAFNVNQTDKANFYNSPVNQVQRLKDAGLNPSLIYGNGGIENTSLSASQQDDIANTRPVADANSMSSLTSFPLQMAQIENIKADTEKKEVEAENISHSTSRDDTAFPLLLQKWRQSVVESKALVSKIRQEVTNLKSENQRIEFDNWLNNEVKDSLIRKIKFDADLSEHVASTFVAGFNAQLGLTKSQTSLNYSNIKLNDSKISLNAEHEKLYQSMESLNASSEYRNYHESDLFDEQKKQVTTLMTIAQEQWDARKPFEENYWKNHSLLEEQRARREKANATVDVWTKPARIVGTYFECLHSALGVSQGILDNLKSAKGLGVALKLLKK